MSVLMLEHAIYFVDLAEGCASILWRNGENAQDAADALQADAQDMLRLGVIDQIVAEPLGRRASRTAGGDAGSARRSTRLCGPVGARRRDLRRQRRQNFSAIGPAIPQ